MFKLGSLFKFESIKQAKSQKNIPDDESKAGVPYVVQSMYNNMVSRNVKKSWLIENNEAPVSGNKIVLGVTLPVVSYQPREFGASQVITASSEWLNERNGFFISASISKQMSNFSYAKKPGLRIYKEMEIKLPTDLDGSIDFKFMESFVAELEAERIAELEAYLKAAGLKDYSLTDIEKQSLANYESLDLNRFRITDIFEIDRGSISNQKELISKADGICFVAQNNSNNGYVDIVLPGAHKVFQENSFIIGRQTGVTYYQESKFVTTDGVLVLTEKEKAGDCLVSDKLVGLFIACTLRNQMRNFGYNNTVSVKKLQDIELLLPSKNHHYNLEFVRPLISAIMKLLIKEVAVFSVDRVKSHESVATKRVEATSSYYLTRSDGK